MPALLLFGLTGLLAQLVNGSLGMGFGVTSNTVLITYGIVPAVASASIQMANVGTGLVSGVSHARFGNVSWPLVVRLGVPGAVGGFTGATVLSSVQGDWVVPAVAVVLLALGVVVVVRSRRGDLDRKPATNGGLRRRFLTPLGLVGGFMNAIGGGGWGPVTTPTLMATGRIEPRVVIGSVSTAEVLVTLSAATGFVLGLSGIGVDPGLVLALMAGGALAAPAAAWVASRVRPARLGVAVGVLLLIVNTRTLLVEVGAPVLLTGVALAGLVGLGVVLMARTPGYDRAGATSREEAAPASSEPSPSERMG